MLNNNYVLGKLTLRTQKTKEPAVLLLTWPSSVIGAIIIYVCIYIYIYIYIYTHTHTHIYTHIYMVLKWFRERTV